MTVLTMSRWPRFTLNLMLKLRRSPEIGRKNFRNSKSANTRLLRRGSKLKLSVFVRLPSARSLRLEHTP